MAADSNRATTGSNETGQRPASSAERQAAALERIAASVEQLAGVLEQYRPALDRAAALGASPIGRAAARLGAFHGPGRGGHGG